MFSLCGTLDMNNVYKIGFHSDTMQAMGPRFGCSFPFIASTVITEHRRQTELIQLIEYIEFHVDSYYETSRALIFRFPPPTFQIIKQTDNQRKKKRKKKTNPKNLFLICLGLHSRLQEAFRIAFESVQSSHSVLKLLLYEKIKL